MQCREVIFLHGFLGLYLSGTGRSLLGTFDLEDYAAKCFAQRTTTLGSVGHIMKSLLRFFHTSQKRADWSHSDLGLYPDSH